MMGTKGQSPPVKAFSKLLTLRNSDSWTLSYKMEQQITVPRANRDVAEIA